VAKRFAETKIWDDYWFQKLPLVYKCLWKYICDKSDEAGIWKVNFSLAEFQIGTKIKWGEVEKHINNGKERVVFKKDFWLIKDFVSFQYGEKVFSSEHAFHKKIRGMLDRVSNTLQEKEKEEVKEKESIKGDSKGGVEVVKKLSPSQEFVKCFSAFYEAATGQPYKTESKHFIIAAKLIKDYGLDAIIGKTKIFAKLCADRSVWFTKDGWADFTIEKLSGRWNNIIPKLTKEEEEKQRFEKLRQKEKERNERIKNTTK